MSDFSVSSKVQAVTVFEMLYVLSGNTMKWEFNKMVLEVIPHSTKNVKRRKIKNLKGPIEFLENLGASTT